MSVIIKGKNPRKPHTIRYWVDGRQRERSFATAREAQDFKIKTDHDTRAQIFVDDKLGREDFGAAVDAWIDRHAVGDSTKAGYRVTARAWVKRTFAGRTIAQVANDRDRVADLLAKDMGHLSITRRRQARTIITGTLDEADLPHRHREPHRHRRASDSCRTSVPAHDPGNGRRSHGTPDGTQPRPRLRRPAFAASDQHESPSAMPGTPGNNQTLQISGNSTRYQQIFILIKKMHPLYVERWLKAPM